MRKGIVTSDSSEDDAMPQAGSSSAAAFVPARDQPAAASAAASATKRRRSDPDAPAAAPSASDAKPAQKTAGATAASKPAKLAKTAAATSKVKDEKDVTKSKAAPAASASAKPAKKKAKASNDSDDDHASSESEDKPKTKKQKTAAAKPKPAAPAAAAKSKSAKVKAESPPKGRAANKNKRAVSEDPTSGDDINPSQSAPTMSQDDKSRNGAGDDDDEDEEEYKWWLDQNKVDGSVKWTTLQHNGPCFAPPYEPHGVQMKYNGKAVALSPESEEVASFFAALIGTEWAENPTFRANFFKDFLTTLAEHDPKCPIKEYAKCDFLPITEYLAELKEKKKAMTKEEKQAIKEEKAKIDAVYGWALLDNRKEKVGNFRIEPPGLFRGRGEHPKTGSLKLRVQPEQVTINIGANDKVPDPPAGHTWGQVVHDNAVSWLAMWKENVNESFKYVFLAANSSLKGQSDFKKFEKARELKKHIDRIRADYTEELKDKVMATRQRATALYFIDRLALRAGNEKGEDEADTVGCCSLRFEHITLEPPSKIIFDFLGKDSIRYYNEVIVDEQVFKNIRIFKREPKKEGDPLFDRLTTASLNKHLNKYMDGLTAKVFRTYNASHTFQEELKKTPADAPISEKILAYNRANRQVAILCNHQRSVPKAHGNQIARLQDKILALKYDRMKVKEQILEADPKLKKKRPELAAPESDLDDDFITRHEQSLEEKEVEKNSQKLEKENEKRKEEGLPPLKELPDSGKRAPASLSLDRLEKKYQTLCERIQTQKMAMIDKDENKTTALSTSKINYIDPRISAAWCSQHGVPLEKMFNKTLREKFKWAMDADKDWVF
ncbi:hypothetical protein BC831DRAFT_490026 [Entophlyctis helioformis]|nr:hypothetical protein BC831DRAFT_490026 [Entophlyctis helioformis]